MRRPATPCICRGDLHKAALSKPVFSFQHPEISTQFSILHHIYCRCGGRSFSTALVGNPCKRGNEIALVFFILQAEPRAASRQTWGASTSPPAFSCLSGVTDSVGVRWRGRYYGLMQTAQRRLNIIKALTTNVGLGFNLPKNLLHNIPAEV